MLNWIERTAERNSNLGVWVIGNTGRRILPTLEREYNRRLRSRFTRISRVRRTLEGLMLNIMWCLHCPNCQRMTRWNPCFNETLQENEFTLTEISCRRCGLSCRDGYLPTANAHREGAWYE